MKYEILIKGTRGGWFWLQIYVKGTEAQQERYIAEYAKKKGAKAFRKVYDPT